jgi:excinuclease UvrABC nuclease subunit
MVGLKIKYEIDNYSGLIEVAEKNIPQNKIVGCYFLFDETKQIIYIGKSSSCIAHRLRCHLFIKRNYYLDEIERRLVFEKRKHYKYFAYCEIPNDWVEIMEVFLIKKYKPKFNYNHNYSNYKPPIVAPTEGQIKRQEEIDDVYLNL